MLKGHGIGDCLIDQLTDRRQRVVVDWEVSGSVLGTVLFLIYLDDDNIKNNVLKLAVDTKVFRKVNNNCDKQHLQKYIYIIVIIFFYFNNINSKHKHTSTIEF